MSHSRFAPSASERWINCPGSMAFDQSQGESSFAYEGSCAHALAQRALDHGKDAAFFIGVELQLDVGKPVIVVNDEMAMYVQVYLDYVRNLAAKGQMLVEQRVDLSDVVGEEAGGTSDAVVLEEDTLHVCDLKYGKGVKVHAYKNSQLRMYGIGSRHKFDIFGPFKKIAYHIIQPRLDHISQWDETVEESVEFEDVVRKSAEVGRGVINCQIDPLTVMSPSDDACRWCRAKAKCPALSGIVEAELGAVFNALPAVDIQGPLLRLDDGALAAKFEVLDLISSWIKAVSTELSTRVAKGDKILGPDGEPYKFVEGKPGNRTWKDKDQATAALVGQLADKAYEPMEIISAPAAAKLLDKKATKALWTDLFAPLIHKPPGKPTLVHGSDPREAFNGAATADEFATGDVE